MVVNKTVIVKIITKVRQILALNLNILKQNIAPSSIVPIQR